MVDWFNQVDATYRADLRELNELNFARFDAKLEQRLVELRAELRTEVGQLGGELRAEIGRLQTEYRTDLAAAKADVIRWMFVFWLGTVGTFIAVGRLMMG